MYIKYLNEEKTTGEQFPVFNIIILKINHQIPFYLVIKSVYRM